MKKLFTASIVFILTGAVASAQTVVKKVLLEEYTTAACGFCPMMSDFINQWQVEHSDQCILMAIHEGFGTDSMSNNLTHAIFSATHPDGGSFAPAMMIDRSTYDGTEGEVYLSNYNSWGSGPGPGIETFALAQMENDPLAGVQITGTYNPDTRMIDATVNIEIVGQFEDANWRVNLILVEDNVVGTPGLGTAAYDQSCYDAAWAEENFPDEFNGSVIIGYPHRHVMRNSFFGNWGDSDVLPDLPEIGTTYSISGSLEVPDNYDDSQLMLVGFVSRYGPGNGQKYVINANSVEVEESFNSTSVTEFSSPSSLSIEKIFPQPANDLVSLVMNQSVAGNVACTITNAYGNVVEQFNTGYLRAGNASIQFDASTLASGMYFVNLKNDSGSASSKLMVK